MADNYFLIPREKWNCKSVAELRLVEGFNVRWRPDGEFAIADVMDNETGILVKKLEADGITILPWRLAVELVGTAEWEEGLPSEGLLPSEEEERGRRKSDEMS